MKRSLVILGCVLAGALHAASIPAPSTSGTLRWMNGDIVGGTLVAATGTTASWQSPLFVEPVVVSWDALHRADWPEATAATSGSDPFIFCMRDGSAIMGDLVSMSGSTVTVKGSRCGVAEIARAQLLSARRLNGNDLVFNGPTGDAGWKPVQQTGNGDSNGQNADSPPGGAPLAELDGGALCLPYWNRGAQLSVNLPDAMDIEFQIHSSDTPDFRLTLGDTPGTDMAIQTWGDEIVVASGADFKFVEPIEGDRDVALRFCWDRATRHCEVFTPDGKQLLDWTISGADTTGKGGLLLQNKGPDLELKSLRIRKWNDAPPPAVDSTKSRLELADGSAVQGAVAENGTDGALEVSGSAAALKDVAAIIFSVDASGTGSAAETLTWSDGTYLKGRIVAVSQGVATVQTAFSTAPLAMQMAGLRELMISATASMPDPAMQATDTLRMGDTMLHGTLAGGADASPHWLPAGGVVPVTPAPASLYEIVRTLPDKGPAAGAPALFYTHMGDVLPGDMHSLDRTGVEFDSGITQATKLPAAVLEAIQFGVGAAGRMHGFLDAGWQVLKGGEQAVRRTGDSIDLDPGSSIGNASAMQSSEIQFRMKTGSGLSAVRLRLFCEGTDPGKSQNLLFASNGMTLMCGSEASEGQFDEPRIDAEAPNGDVVVRVEILDESVNVYLNGVCAMKLPMSATSRAGAGLIIEPAGVWGNTAQTISLSDFSMTARPGVTWLPDVAQDAKDEALSIPRFRRDDPPLHALIAANGDILRGEIEAATTTSFGFRSGMEELVVPRDRVKAVIWLGKPVDTQPAAAPSHSADAILDQKMNTMITFGEANLDSITRWMAATYPGLVFKLPADKKGQISRRVSMVRLGGGTVSETLDRVCALYGMKYKMNDAGEIVIEPDSGGSGATAQMVEKVYWLKPGSLPADAPAVKTLAAKGIDFPAGATADWQSAEGQLTVLNTAANQAEIAQMLAADFVSGIGSPTHWLVLTSGARLGLAVDKFGKDSITGWHPLYGHCTIRTQDVAMVRTYPLTPSAAMKSLQGWQPYYAPEPVLPTAGGDSDASVGKPATPFKLSLLGGAKFDLAAAKGKIVVLDFWATWCGPCVRSLPGLIDSMTGFPPDRVVFLGVNEDEPATAVQQFLETRGWKLTVALDAGGTVGQKYGADSIPHTVIVGPDGKIAWVKTGYTPDGDGDAAKEVTQLLGEARASH